MQYTNNIRQKLSGAWLALAFALTILAGLTALTPHATADTSGGFSGGGYFGCPSDATQITPDNPYCKQNCQGLGMNWDADQNKCTSTCPPGQDQNGEGKCAPVTDQASTNDACATAGNCDLLNKYLNPLIQLLAALVGIAVTASIIIGGIQYGSSAGDPQKAAAAKARIRNAIIALVTFIFLYALLNFLVPGGLFNK